MRILAILRPPAGSDPRDAVAQHAHQEMQALWDLYRTGVVREMYSPGGLGAILILEAESLEDADRHLASLPLLTNQIMSLELTELHPFSALQMLFRTETVKRAHPTSARGSELAS
jgi:hypothetical protein